MIVWLWFQLLCALPVEDHNAEPPVAVDFPHTRIALRGPIPDSLQNGVIGIEEVLRGLAEGLQSAGTIDDKTVAAIGAIYGFAHEGNEFAQDAAHPELFAKSIPILLDICIGAARKWGHCSRINKI